MALKCEQLYQIFFATQILPQSSPVQAAPRSQVTAPASNNKASDDLLQVKP